MKKGLVDVLSFSNDEKFDNYDCSICREGKQSRLAYDSYINGTRAKIILEIMHADVCNPMENLVVLVIFLFLKMILLVWVLYIFLDE